MTDPTTDQLDPDEFNPVEIELRLADTDIVVREFTFGQSPKAAKLIRLLQQCTKGENGDQVDMLEMLEKGGEHLMQLLALAAGKPRSFLDRLKFDEGLQLLGAVINVNQALISKKVLPLLVSATLAAVTAQLKIAESQTPADAVIG